jgi:hypothetical protein
LATGAVCGSSSGITSRAELSSLASTLEELVRRVTALAEHAADGGDEEAATELFAVERSLQGALRKLQRAGGI